MAGTIISVLILVAVLGTAAWFLFFRQPKPKQSSARQLTPTPHPGQQGSPATASGDQHAPAEEEGDGAMDEGELLPDDKADESDDNRSWKELVTEAQQLHREGSYDSAIDTYELALELAREELGRGSDEVADILLAQGASYQARDDEEDDNETFPPCYPRALAILERNHGPFSERLLPALRHLISFYDQTGRHGEADSLKRRYENILRKKQDAARQVEDALRQAQAEGTANTADHTAGSDQTANGAETAPSGDTTSGAPRPPTGTPGSSTNAPRYFGIIAFASSDSAACAKADKLFAELDYDGALDAYSDVAETLRSERGRDAIELVEALTKSALVLQDRDDEDDEREYYPVDDLLRALAIAEQHKGPLHPSLAPILVALISCYDQDGEHNNADTLIWRLESLAA